MPLSIAARGIAERRVDGSFVIVRPCPNGGAVREVEVPAELAEQYRLWSGDIVSGPTEPIGDAAAPDPESAERTAEPSHLALRCEGERSAYSPAERLVAVDRVNGLPAGEAVERPSPRERRSHFERTPPDERVDLALRADDYTGRTLDLAAPFGLGSVGVVLGAHATGLTRTLRAVADAISAHAPDCLLMVLLLNARSEEATEWRRRFAGADVVVCPAAQGAAPADQAVRVADLALQAAQRHTELARDVVVLIDSLSALWGAMLESEDADAQREADQAAARQRIREMVQRAGCFHGEGLLGGGLGGSLTVIGTVWHRATDPDAEEDGEVHPHLRLLEHITPDIDWRVALSGELAGRRLYPAIDLDRCFSRHEERLLDRATMEAVWSARQALRDADALTGYRRVCDAIDTTADLGALAQALADAG